MSDMSAVIIPKSDQLNSDDLISGPITVKITGVTIRNGGEQPISVSFDGDNGKPYKPCKSMCRVMVTAWGADSKQYAGRSMTLYRDPTVKWAGMDVGGIRISHMTHIESTLTLALTMSKSNRKPFTVKPLKVKESAGLKDYDRKAEHTGVVVTAAPSSPADLITDDEAIALDAACSDNGINVASLKKAAGVERLAMIKAADLQRAKAWVAAAIEKRKATA